MEQNYGRERGTVQVHTNETLRKFPDGNEENMAINMREEQHGCNKTEGKTGLNKCFLSRSEHLVEWPETLRRLKKGNSVLQ